MPSFVTMTGPGEAVITDDAAVEIALQTTIIAAAIATAVKDLKGIPKAGSTDPGSLGDIANKLDAINGNLALIIQNYKTVSSVASKIHTNISSAAISKEIGNNIAKSAVSDKIKENNFYKIYNGETPKLKSPMEILKEKIKDALNFSVMMKTQGIITQALDDTAEELQNYFKEVAEEFGITKYVQDTIESFKVKIPNPELEVKKLQADTNVTTYQDA